MDIIGYVARVFAEFQWNQELSEDLHNSWIEERTKKWQYRLRRTGSAMASAEFVSFLIVMIFFIEGEMSSYVFTRWLDIIAIPALIGIDFLLSYIAKDAGLDPDVGYATLVRIVMVALGLYCGFMFPLLLVLTAILTMYGVPLVARRVAKAFQSR